MKALQDLLDTERGSKIDLDANMGEVAALSAYRGANPPGTPWWLFLGT